MSDKSRRLAEGIEKPLLRQQILSVEHQMRGLRDRLKRYAVGEIGRYEFGSRDSEVLDGAQRDASTSLHARFA